MPHPRVETSVTRHLSATEQELWAEGARVATLRKRTLYGRADVFASACIAEGLEAVSAPIAENPNHSNIVGWPADKPLQKIKAIQLAAKSQYLPVPTSHASDSIASTQVDSDKSGTTIPGAETIVSRKPIVIGLIVAILTTAVIVRGCN